MSYPLTSVRAKHFFTLCCYFQVISQLETSCLRDVYTDWSADNHPVTHLRFDYISRERQSRDYVMEDHEAAVVSNIQLLRERLSYKRGKAYTTMSKDIMGNGDFYVCLSKRQSVSARWKETGQTHVFVLSRSLLLNHLEPQSSKTKLLLPIMPIGIVAYAFTLSWDNLCRNSCISFSPNGIFNLRFS